MIIGLTGGIGSGKSTVLGFFQELGYKTYVADIEAKRLMHEDAALKQQIIDLFGSKAYSEGELNRPYLSKKAFNDKNLLQQLNALVHPKVRADFITFKEKQSKNSIIIYEAAILFESGTHRYCDYIITVISNLEDRMERLLVRDQTTRDEIQKRMHQQSSDEEKMRKSHFIIRNHQLNYTKMQVVTISNILSKIVKI